MYIKDFQGIEDPKFIVMHVQMHYIACFLGDESPAVCSQGCVEYVCMWYFEPVSLIATQVMHSSLFLRILPPVLVFCVHTCRCSVGALNSQYSIKFYSLYRHTVYSLYICIYSILDQPEQNAQCTQSSKVYKCMVHPSVHQALYVINTQHTTHTELNSETHCT